MKNTQATKKQNMSTSATTSKTSGRKLPDNDVTEERYNKTDLGNAKRLVDIHGRDLWYCKDWNRWFFWNGNRVVEDRTGEAMRRAKDVVRIIQAEAGAHPDEIAGGSTDGWGKKSEAAARLRAMVKLAESEPGIPLTPEELDRDLWLLNCSNGTIDLRTGELREHRREDLITALCPVMYEPNATAPTWIEFLKRIMDGNQEIIDYIKRAVGYSLTGITTERVLFLLFGTGANGKSVFLEVIRTMLGPEYARRTPTSTLLTRSVGAVPNDVARLRGAHFVYALETDEGKHLAEARIKELVGGDAMVARFMRAEWFEFPQTFKVWLATNHKPVIQGNDEGIWDRIRLLPFTVRIPEDERDPKLIDKLRKELTGILAWAVEGCIEWQSSGGLREPPEIKDALASYRSEMDVLGAFLTDRCKTGSNEEATARELYIAYVQWSDDSGERQISKRMFGTRLDERGFTKHRGTGGKRLWRGVGLIVEAN